MICSACGAENEPGRKFCGECGSSLAAACPACGTPNPATAKFCGECGSSLVVQAPPPEETRPLQASERRLVSVLFADLVGFTTLSESRDPEDVRELLSRYFDSSRELIARYGGTVEKFIGDAVMAVWGTPVAQEDDAERAVRAALELVAMVETLGQEVHAPELRARAGVLTGEAAVTLGAEGQGMVAGDLVNSASRIQAEAPPGAVFVGEVTRRATEAAIAYDDAGSHELKGKAEPIPLWRATRVVAGARGQMRSTGLESPFVGRDREIRTIKELFHATADERKAHLVSVAGVAGFGKSRLVWEFFKYADGLPLNWWWHRGRCLAYGEGVTYYALAEMVRMRARIAEGEESASALEKLHAAVEAYVGDPDERKWIEPRLAHLLGLAETTVREKEDLFSAWRLFFERLAERDPCVMVFEDIHWADPALLDFIEYLLEWSRAFPLFVLTLSRPELLERRPNWGTGRGATSMYLGPLPHEAMEDLMRGFVPGLPEETTAKILERAEGVPLYAVETVRMLLDRGVLVREGDEYRVAASVETLEVPETLHALIAARLDGLTPEERKILQDASVLGKTFTKSALASLSGLPESEVDDLLSSLTRKEFLSIQADPRSPERGQYGFLQDLVKLVAYETLSKKDRKARHLAAAVSLEQTWGPDDGEIVEVLASHYLEAYRAVSDAPDADAIKQKARRALMRAGEHAGSLGANEQAQYYFQEAIELTADPLARAELMERAGMMARDGGRNDEAADLFEGAIDLLGSAGATHPAARVSARLGEIIWQQGRSGEAIELMDKSFKEIANEEQDEDLAMLAAQLGRFLFFEGRRDLSAERLEVALDIAEALWLPEVLSQALNTKAIGLQTQGRQREALALLRDALQVALENDLPSSALRAYYNLGDVAAYWDRYQEGMDHVRSGLALARRVGNRVWEWQVLGQIYPFYAAGEWDEVMAMTEGIPRDRTDIRLAKIGFVGPRLSILVHRGAMDEARESFAVFPEAETSDDVQERITLQYGKAVLLRTEGRYEEALDWALQAFAARDSLGISQESVKEGFLQAVEAAFDMNDLPKVEELLGEIEPLPRGKVPPFLRGMCARFRSRLAGLRGEHDAVEPGLKTAAGMFRELGSPFWLAVTLLEHGEWLAGQGRGAAAGPLLNEAREIFERLRAAPWLERVEKASAGVGAPA